MAVPIVRTITPILSGPFAETLVEAMLLPRRPGLLERLVSPSRKQIHPREDQGEEGQGPADEVRRRDTEMVEGEPGEGRSDDHGQAEDGLQTSHEPALRLGRCPVGDDGCEAGDGEPHPQRQEADDRVEEDTGRDQCHEDEVEADKGESANEESALSEAWLEASDQEPLRDYGAHPYESEEEGV